MNIVIRVDASIHIGNGHVMRCLVLATGLKTIGHDVVFYSRPQQGDLINFIRKKGFTVIELATPIDWLIPQDSADYDAWLQVPWKEDAEDLVEKSDHVDLLIVDHYGLNANWELFVKNKLSCKIFAIDDLVRTHNAELILDQTLLRNAIEYEVINPFCIILTGCNFALLNSVFMDFRKKLLTRKKVLSKNVRVLVTMGGVDTPNATLRALEALSAIKKTSPINVTVLLDTQAPHYSQIRAFSVKNSDWILHLNFVENMAELMSQHCIAIGAPGSSSWERACLGLPSIIVPLAKNQSDIARNLEVAKATIKIELSEFDHLFPIAYKVLLNNWQKYHETNLALCDGLGKDRVIQEIKNLF